MKLSGLFCLATIITLSGCSSTSYKSISVISDPPGAKIEVNGSYVGQAPVTVTAKCWPDDQVAINTETFRALPFRNGQYVQTKQFVGPNAPFDPHHDVLPDTILFQMDLKPQQ